MNRESISKKERVFRYVIEHKAKAIGCAMMGWGVFGAMALPLMMYAMSPEDFREEPGSLLRFAWLGAIWLVIGLCVYAVAAVAYRFRSTDFEGRRIENREGRM